MLANDYPRAQYEIIVVDNGSTDHTASLAGKYADRVLACPGLSVAAQRNAGAAQAKGRYLAFLDADCIAQNNWLRRAQERMQKELCVTDCRVVLPDNPSWVEEAWFGAPATDLSEVKYINSGNLFVPRAIFQQAGGFNEALRTGEDAEFALRAKKYLRIISDPAIQAVHLGNPKTLRMFIKREIWHGLGAFGSFRIDWKDKPLFGTFLFVIFTLMQLAGIAYWSPSWILAGTLLLLLLLSASALNKAWPKTSPPVLLRLTVLYYCYFLGRSIALILLSLRKTQYYYKTQQDLQSSNDHT